MTPKLSDYFDGRAIDTWRAVSGPADTDLTEVAVWARTAWAVDKRNVGILVDQAGRIVAHTECIRGSDGYSTSFVQECAVAPDAENQRLVDVGDVVERAAGGQAVHLRFWQLCQGAGR